MKHLLLATALLMPAALQAETQLASLQQAVDTCSRHDVMPTDWEDKLDGWIKSPISEDAINRVAAFDGLVAMADDNILSDGRGVAERLALHAEMAEAFAYDLRYITEAAEAGILTQWTHPSGWTLALEVDADPYQIAHSLCLFWHDAPDDAVTAHLNQPYMTAVPRQMFGSTFNVIEARVTDTEKFAPVAYTMLIPDTPTLPLATYPATHPFQYAAAVYLEVHLSAFSREDG